MYIGRKFIKDEKTDGKMLRYTNASKTLVGNMWSIAWNECLSPKKHTSAHLVIGKWELVCLKKQVECNGNGLLKKYA